jgi:hypothetical protein
MVTVAADLFKVLPAIWKEAMRRGDAEAASDLIGSIAPEKLVFDGEVVRTPFESTAKALFGPESQKIKNATPGNGAASCQVHLIGSLSNPASVTALARLYRLRGLLAA